MSMKTDPISDEVKDLNNWFYKMYSHRNKVYPDLVNDEQLYFSDVEGTRTQFNQSQYNKIKKRYDIPISTKISWAIIEQMLSFLTGAKPYPRLISSSHSEQAKEYARSYEQAVEAMWYESDMNGQVSDMLRDGLVVGLGWIYIRPNDFYSETTFGVVGEYIDWRHVLVDPHSKKPDFSDAEYLCIAEYLPTFKIEKQLGITISKDIGDYWTDLHVVPYDTGEANDFISPSKYAGMTMSGKQDKYVYAWKRHYFHKMVKTVYVTQEGNIASKRPEPIQVPNPEKIALGQQIQEMMAQSAAMVQQAEAQIPTEEAVAGQVEQGAMQPREEAEMTQAPMDAQMQMEQMTMQIQQMQLLFAEMPDKVTHYLYEPLSVDAMPKKSKNTTSEADAERGRKEVTPNYSEIKRKVIESIILVGNKVVERQILPVDEYPLIPFSISHARAPRKVYGIMHYIKDIVKAMNKFWALLLYDMQTNSHRKVIYPKGAIINPVKAEQDWSRPNAWIEYNADQMLPNSGEPTVIDPSNLNPAITSVMTLLQQLLEYSTGISAIVQGQNTASSPMPDSFGGIQAYQTFGTQRIKLYARSLQRTMEKMIYVIATYLAAYAPKEKIINYLDEDGNPQEVQLYEPETDHRFFVRMNLQSNLPTQRAQAAQMLGIIGGQTQNPVVADLITKYVIQYMDMPESRKISEEIDLVQNLQSQLDQVTKATEDLSNKNSQLEQQLFQAQLEAKKIKAEMEIEKELALRKAEIEGAAGGNIDEISTEIDMPSTEAMPEAPPEEQQAPQPSNNAPF